MPYLLRELQKRNTGRKSNEINSNQNIQNYISKKKCGAHVSHTESESVIFRYYYYCFYCPLCAFVLLRRKLNCLVETKKFDIIHIRINKHAIQLRRVYYAHRKKQRRQHQHQQQ